MEIFAILLIFMAVSFVESRIYERYALQGVRYTLKVSANEVFEGDEIEIVEEASNYRWFAIPWLKTEITVSQWLEFAGTKPDKKSGLRFVPSVFMLKGHQKCTRVWKVKCLKRGVYRLDDTRIYTSDLFGLSFASRLVEIQAEIIVLPTPSPQTANEMSSYIFYGNRIVRRFVAEDPFAVFGVREYNGDEPMNRIHWTSTAKANQIMVYNTEFTTENNILLLINFQLSEFGELNPAPDSYIETAVKQAAWFLEKAKNNGMNIAIITNSTCDGFSYAYLRHFEGLQRLAQLENECGMSFSNLMETLDVSRFTDIFIFTSYISEKIAAAAKSYRGKNVVFYCNANSNERILCEDGKIIPVGIPSVFKS